jgi:hypothetical protein
MGSIAKMVAAAKAIDKSNAGYDQNQRRTFFDGKKLVKNKECDCSTCCGVIAKLGGYPVDLSGTFYTGNFAAKLKKAGFKVFKFTNLSAVKVGDFLLKPGKHVEFVSAKDKFFSAHIDERGKASGGKAGDQTGKEVGYRSPYNYAGGWEYIVRPPAEKADSKPAASTSSKKTIDQIAREVIAGKWGDGDVRKKKLKAAGYDVVKVQARVNAILKR